MTQVEWGAQPVAPTGNPANSTSIISWAGAVMSLGLVVGLGIWGYQLAVRDVSGVPVVRALEGPMRVQPEDPGGLAAQHQGLAVNAVQADGTAAAPADRLTLAPRPVELAAEDTPADPSAMLAIEAAPMAEADEIAAAATDQAVAVALSQENADPVAAALALADAITEGVAPLSDEQVDVTVSMPTPTPTPAPAAPVETARIIPASVPGVKVSPLPKRRPDGLAERAAEIVAAQVAARTDSSPAAAPIVGGAGQDAVQDIDAASLPVGTRLVQLGAFDSEDVARSEWTKLAGRFEDYMGGKARVIEKAQSGGKTFYRLRAMGFEDLSDARRFCSVLMAGKSACIPVVTR